VVSGVAAAAPAAAAPAAGVVVLVAASGWGAVAVAVGVGGVVAAPAASHVRRTAVNLRQHKLAKSRVSYMLVP
jgi:hypothetical protein